MASLEAEGKHRTGGKVGCHTLSPGMIITDLLLSGATVGNKARCPAVRHLHACPVPTCACMRSITCLPVHFWS